MHDHLSELDLIRQDWLALPADARIEKFHSMDRETAEDLFLSLSSVDQAEIIVAIPHGQRRSWLRMLPLDDMADLIQQLPDELKDPSIALLDPDSRREIHGLLAYADDDAGGLMTPHFIRMRPDMEVGVAIRYLRAYSRHHEQTIYYTYVVDSDQKLLGIISFRELLLSLPNRMLHEIMKTDFVSVLDTMDQEEVAKVFSAHQLSAIPVVDAEGRVKGVVTYDDIADAIAREATEDIQKIGGMEALDLPYWKTDFVTIVRKRAGWLTILFVGQMFTATAMAHYEGEIERAIVLALFIPLIISSGGNTGSQASTLIIRAMALSEVKVKDWWRVLFRESGVGLTLGLILGALGLLRIVAWPGSADAYGPHYVLVAYTVAASLVGVVIWGATIGSMLPFLLRRFGLDPASASAPFVATVVDVTGLVIYFTVAQLILSGTLI
jgi:magnesium transporter